jgi:hypothetical protein
LTIAAHYDCDSMRPLLAALSLASLGLLSAEVRASDWITAPSTYTHDPRTAERVSQYSPIGPVYVFSNPNRVQSGYRHIASTIRVKDAADYLHIVEQWGAQPVRPYGEWQFPFRPYSVPYSLWGPEYAYPPYGYPYLPYGEPYPPYPEPYYDSFPHRDREPFPHRRHDSFPHRRHERFPRPFPDSHRPDRDFPDYGDDEH